MATDQSFSSFVHANSTSLYRTAYLLTQDPALAEELLQDVLVRMYPMWSRVGSMAAPAAYVRRSLVNAFVSRRRRSSARDLGLGPEHDVVGGPDLAEQTADRDLAWRLLGTLPSRQRAALVLRYYEDLPDAEIARALGCRVSTVRSLVSRGLRSLRAGGLDPAPASTNTPTDRLGRTRS
jgi:RNA polymerase sigma-70 factor (sigma-E family)